MTWSLPDGKAAAGVSFGSFGELLQGALPNDEGDFLVTMPIEKHSVAYFIPSSRSDKVEVFPRWKTNSQQLAQTLIQQYHHNITGGSLFVASEIPCGKGLSSSSADLVATARAIEAYLGLELPVDELCRRLSEVEPTDGVMFSESVTYLHLKGALFERLGLLSEVEILSLDEGGHLYTLDYHRQVRPDYSAEQRRLYRHLLEQLRRGFAGNNLDVIGAVATSSAYINQQFNPKKHLDLMHAVCKKTGGAGVITTHSGTCQGILYDATKPQHIENRERAAAELRAYGRLDVYKTIKLPLKQAWELDWNNMIEYEMSTPLASGSRLRPLFRRLFYREEPFVVLESSQLRMLYEAFACVVRLHPLVLYWIHRLAEDEYLVSSFRHRSMLQYSGLEVVHVTPDVIDYYQLPGAKVGGCGQVVPGGYAISIQAPGRVRHYLRMRKCRHEQLHLDEIGSRVESQATFLSLERHPLDRSKFADEMRMIVERAIEWDYQRALLGQPDPLNPADRAEVSRKCAGISPQVDAYLEHLQRKGSNS